MESRMETLKQAKFMCKTTSHWMELSRVKYKIGRVLFVLCVRQLFSLVALQIYQWCCVIININSYKELLEEVSGKCCCWNSITSIDSFHLLIEL